MVVSDRLSDDIDELRLHGHAVAVEEEGTRIYVVIKDFALPEC
jgi:hypothetical protein